MWKPRKVIFRDKWGNEGTRWGITYSLGQGESRSTYTNLVLSCCEQFSIYRSSVSFVFLMHVHILRSNEPQNELDIQKNCSVWNKNIAKHKLAYKLHIHLFVYFQGIYSRSSLNRTGQNILSTYKLNIRCLGNNSHIISCCFGICSFILLSKN